MSFHGDFNPLEKSIFAGHSSIYRRQQLLFDLFDPLLQGVRIAAFAWLASLLILQGVKTSTLALFLYNLLCFHGEFNPLEKIYIFAGHSSIYWRQQLLFDLLILYYNELKLWLLHWHHFLYYKELKLRHWHYFCVGFSWWIQPFGKHICGALSRYPYKVGDHKSPKSKKNAWKAELGHTAF